MYNPFFAISNCSCQLLILYMYMLGLNGIHGCKTIEEILYDMFAERELLSCLVFVTSYINVTLTLPCDIQYCMNIILSVARPKLSVLLV